MARPAISAAVLRNFKKFTCQTIIRTLEEKKNASRRNRMLWLFKETDGNKKVSYQFWQPNNNLELCCPAEHLKQPDARRFISYFLGSIFVNHPYSINAIATPDVSNTKWN